MSVVEGKLGEGFVDSPTRERELSIRAEDGLLNNQLQQPLNNREKWLGSDRLSALLAFSVKQR